jgi:uncharacterized membrane-anchored protein YitT (DUF2179 family)
VSQFLIEPRFPEGFDAGWFAEVNALVAAVCGWKIMGHRAATLTVPGSISLGFTTIVMTAIAALFVQSFYDMLIRSMRRQYDGPVEAVVNVFELMSAHLVTIATVEIWIMLILGGMIAGVVTGYFGRIWR